jgi:hypothetical protein
MVLRRAIIVASFGDRDAYLTPLLKNIRMYTNLPVQLITDKRRDLDFTSQCVLDISQFEWRDHPRWGVRNTNLWLAKAALWEEYDSVCCLNDDMRIVNKDFIDGFGLAEKFGVCVPINPRIYVKYNAMGTDASNEDRQETDKGPIYGPACNMSPMFACRLHDHARQLLEAYIEELHNCMRGTLAFWLASYRTAITPLYLPEQWCVCGSSAKFIRDYKKTLQGRTYPIEPMMLHWGQAEVREVFKGVYDGVD